ncbi:MAG: RNA polymerase factor sigma-54 [Lentimicrobiaceae bacterium]|nr:RNA polymerase factor sigma-54 [Lentimicrobiaceae bacterium]
MQKIKLEQRLLQKLSPQQILLMKLLQIPSIALEQRIKQEIEENPALEDIAGEENLKENEQENEENQEEYDADNEEFDITDYVDDDETPSYRLNSYNTSPDDEFRETPFVSGLSFHEYLQQQLGLRQLTEKENTIAQTIIGNLDEAGYLQREVAAMVDDLAFSQNISTTKNEILDALKYIQQLDPPGVGARNLQECIILQLQRMNATPPVQLAIRIIDRYFDDFTKKHYDKIIKKTNIDEARLKQAVNEILRCNPKPGSYFSDTSKSNQYITPDFILTNKDGDLELSLNAKNTPELRISKTYLDMLEAYSENKNNVSHKEAVSFIKQKLDSAKWFIDAIKQRQNTLYITMNAILQYQKEYFLEGDETKLKPMILKDIAELVHLDISTISRVANSKYVQTPFGIFLLKSFFSESMQTDSGEEVSTREIKKILSNCIEAENKSKPLTDEQLTDILIEKGYNIARRTVAKYREQLNISIARLRKEL